MKKALRFLLISVCIAAMLVPAVSAASPYQTHTYMAKTGDPYDSPDAYTPTTYIDAAYMGTTEFSEVSDMFVDDTGNVYIVDSKKSVITVLDRYYKLKFTISSFVNDQGVTDSFTEPKGLFVKTDSTGRHIYVCDTNANRLVIFDGSGNFERIIEKPQSKLFGSDAIYKPIAVAVDDYGRIYVISSSTYQGVIVLTQDGTFTGFIGAQSVTYNAIEYFWRLFQTAEQRKNSLQNIPTEYNNIAISDDNFIYVTSSSITASQQKASIRSKTGKYSPVKMLNTAGKEVMKRTGFFDPGGEVYTYGGSAIGVSGVSKIVDVALGPEGTWTIIDQKRSKCYTYDFAGNLLFAFGDMGKQLGNLTTVKAVAYQGDTLLLLDSSSKSITAYKRTEYGDTLISAIANDNAKLYDKAIDYWTEILKRNSNFDAAYIGIGQALYREANYEEAMTYYKSAYDTTNYSDAYKEVRKEWLAKVILLIPVVIIAVCILLSKMFKAIGKFNKATALKTGKRTYWQELLYPFHLCFHPFDGFWDLKHEKRGSVRAGTTILGITIVCMYYQSIGTGYVVNPYGNYSSILSVASSVIVPLALWIIANWCLTTLFDGEGSFKDIYIATTYSLAPLPLFVILSTVLSNVMVSSETNIYSLLGTFGYIWVGFLLFFGMMVTHDYSMGKNILITLSTIVGMAFIMFVGILFSSLVQKMVSFVSNIVIEVTYRM